MSQMRYNPYNSSMVFRKYYYITPSNYLNDNPYFQSSYNNKHNHKYMPMIEGFAYNYDIQYLNILIVVLLAIILYLVI
jgi:hypothetical protein